MPLGTALFHSPGWNEGKARNGTLGTRRQTRIELRRSGTNRASVWFVSLRFVALHSLGKCRSYGAQNVVGIINPGLAPWAMKKCRPYRALLRFYHQSIILLFSCACAGLPSGGGLQTQLLFVSLQRFNFRNVIVISEVWV